MARNLRTAFGLTLRTGARRRVLLALILLSPTPLLQRAGAVDPGEPPGQQTSHEASTSDKARREAAAAIPLAKIDAAHRQAVREVVQAPSVFRRLPTNVIDCRPELFTYFAQNPDVLVSIWRTMGLSRVELTRTGERTFDLSDGAGTKVKLTIVEQSCDGSAQNRIVMYAQGGYEGKPFPRPITAQCVLLLRSGSVVETNGRQYVAARLDSFVKLDRPTTEIMAKAASPFVGKTSDRNFADTLAFIANFSYTAENRPEAIAKLSDRLQQVDAPRRAELTTIASRCAEANDEWRVSRAEGPVVKVSAQ